MTKHKSIIATYILAFALCLTLVWGVCLGATTLVAHAEEGKNMPQIVSVGGKMVDQINNMVNMPVGIVGEEYYAEIVTANAGDKVSIKAYDENTRGCLPKGLTFDAEKKVISGKLGLFSEDKNNDGITIYCTNEYGSTNILAWLNIYTEADKPTLASEAISETAYVGSLYSAMVEVGGYNKSFKVTLEGSYPENMEAGRSGVNAYIQFTPTSDMAGEYNFTICVDNGLGVVRKDCTINVANEVVAPKFITKTQPLGYSEENSDGVRPVVGKSFEFWLQASGTNTEDNPIEFFAYDKNTNAKATPNSNNEYDLGNGLFLTKDGKIYSNCVLEAEGQTTGTQAQITFYIGASNKSAEGNEQGTGSIYCRLNIVKGYVVDDIIITPAETDVPKGGTRQFEVEVKGAGELPKAVWSFYYTPDVGTTISQTGLVTVGLNESRKFITVSVTVGTRHKEASITVIDHIHTTSVVEAVEKTCTTEGKIKHYKCTICDGLFVDVGATQNLTEADVKLEAGHELSEMVGLVAPTCSTKGMQAHYRCENCDKYFALGSLEEVTAESLEIAIDPNGHDLVHVEGTAANCATEGVWTHENCKLCHKNYYSDGVTEMADIVEPKNDNHDLETVWTAIADGHYHKCNRTGCKDNGKVDFAAHTKDRENATEENAVKCTVCDYVITPALGHTHHLDLVPGKAATCQADGKKAYYTCDGCSEKFEDEAGTIAITTDIETWRIIPKAHKFGEWTQEVPATKETAGTKAHKDCEFCGKHFDNDGNEITDLIIAKLPSDGDGEVVEPKKEGLSGGAIAGIVIGSVAGAGIIVFAILWFAIKKKSFADLIAAIKGIFKKK